MNNFSSRTLAAVLLLLVLACAGCVGAEEPSGQSTEKKARATGTPVVLDFGKGQCNQCIQQTAAIDEVGPQCDGKVDFKFVHVIEEVALAGSYQIFMIPTLVFLDAGGEEVFRNVGMLNADALRNKLEELGWAEF